MWKISICLSCFYGRFTPWTFRNVITSVLFHVVLYMQVLPTEEELPGLKQDSPPFILIVGELPNYDDIFIVAKGERILNVSGGHFVAFKCLVCFYYTQACTNTYIFLPKHALQIFDSHKIPVNETELGSTFCDCLRSRSPDRRWSQKCVSIWSKTIVELSAICDRLRSYGNQP